AWTKAMPLCDRPSAVWGFFPSANWTRSTSPGSPRRSAMETKTCDSPTTENEKTGRWYLVVPVLALCFQLVPPVLLWAVSTSAYAEPRRLPESWERPVSLLTLGLSASVSLLLGSIGVYGLLIRARPKIAAVLIVVCCMPALLGGAVYL